MQILTPDWVKQAVFYQIFPDRFARGSQMKHPASLKFKPWGSPPEKQGFQGGDLYGIVEKLDYLQDLGITALYLNPIFSSAANHRYHTFDYYQVDPLLGGNEALRALLDEAHRREMRIVLDGVFNHASRGFWAFHHILETGKNSPYLDWFIIRDWPLRPYSSKRGQPANYAAWWNLPALPKFNYKNPDVQQYFLDVARHWIEFGCDGWRLDVPQDIKSEPFWKNFRKVVKAANPEAYICGEIWHLAPEWLQGDKFDALMNYPIGEAILGFLAAETIRTEYRQSDLKLRRLSAKEFGERLREIFGSYDWQVNLAQMNFFGSHDTARVRWMAGDDMQAVALSYQMMLAMPGAPCIYYGDEIGLDGAQEPGSRGAFPWDSPQVWNNELRSVIRDAIALRKRYRCLQDGQFLELYAQGSIYAFARYNESDCVIALFNAAPEAAEVEIELPQELQTMDHLRLRDADNAVNQAGRWLRGRLPARRAAVLVPENG